MTAILLAAGVGKRMGNPALPKCLLSIGGRTLLRRTLEDLRSMGVRKVVVVTGFEKEKVAEEARRYAGSQTVHILENPRFREGAVLSLWTARSFLDRDVLIMDADVLCSPAALERLLRSPHANCFLVDASAQDTGEEQMVFGRGDRAFQITKKPSEELRRSMSLFGESVGFLKLNSEAALELREVLERTVAAGTVGIEHEQVYPELMAKVIVSFEPVKDFPWTEIDTPEDFRRARQEVFPRMQDSPCINRLMARAFLPWVLRLPLTPNQWTFVSLVLGLSSAVLLSSGDYGDSVRAALLFQLFYLADDWDGAVARARGRSSFWGGWFDVAVDAVVQTGLVLALTLGLLKQGWPAWVGLIGAVATAGIVMDFVVTLRAKARGYGPAVVGDPARQGAEAKGLRLPAWLLRNLTQENFSLVLVAALLLDQRVALLAAMAVGCHLYWMNFLRDTMRS